MHMNIASVLNAVERLASSMMGAPPDQRLQVYGTIRALVQDLRDLARAEELGGYTLEKLTIVKIRAQAIAGLCEDPLGSEISWHSDIRTALESLRSDDCFGVV